jgi:hypothetical protein
MSSPVTETPRSVTLGSRTSEDCVAGRRRRPGARTARRVHARGAPADGGGGARRRAANRRARIGPGDEFELRFPFYPDLNDRITVGPDGRVSLQLVNTVAIGGLTVSEATRLLNERYARVIRDPQATVTIRAFAPQEIFVDGWVANPGLVRSDVPLDRVARDRPGRRRQIGRAYRRHPGAAPHPRWRHTLLSGRAGKLRRRRHFGRGSLAQYLRRRLCSAEHIGTIGDFLANYVKNVPFYANYPIP